LYFSEEGVTVLTPLASAEELVRDHLNRSLVLPSLRSSRSVAELAYVALRDAILAMDVYHPEADLRLDEKRLAAALGVSRTPVRHALARLEHDGLVRIEPRRGVYIALKTKAEIVEMITVWSALESLAARITCERASDEEIGALRELFATFEDGEVRLRLDEYSAANLRFHQRIVELGRSPLLQGLAGGLLAHVRAIRGATIGDADRPERSVVDHRQIIEALEARDAERAERLVREHALALAAHVRSTLDHLDPRTENPAWREELSSHVNEEREPT
jgi:DNA-binding GntR family transcriptional regulator